MTYSSILFSMYVTLSSRLCMSVKILLNREERSVINDDCRDINISFKVVSITGWPVVGGEGCPGCVQGLVG